MRKYLVAAALIVSFAAPAIAADEGFVMMDLDTKKCVTMKAMPSDMKKYKMLSKYPTLGEAETAMLTMTECK